MENIEEKIELIETFRDRYFENFPSKSDENRCVDVKNRVKELLQKSFPQKDKENVDLSLLLLRARIWNLCIDYVGECEELLSQYVKLKPSDPKAWTELGSCLLKKPDIEYALECLECGYDLCQSADLLSLLATVIRFTLGGMTDKKASTQARQRSIELSERAVKLDRSSGPAWLSLANARFGSFFHLEQDHFETLERATEAYQKALEDRRTAYDPALHLNLATAFRYLNRYSDSITHLKRAHLYEPFSPITIDRLKSLNKMLSSVSDGVKKYGGITEIPSLETTNQKLDPIEDFGSSLSYEALHSLKPGTNAGVYTIGTIVADVVSVEEVPRIFLIADGRGFCAAISIYNCSNHFKLSNRDQLTIATPMLSLIENVEVVDEENSRVVSFYSIRVASPLQILRNGQKVKSSEIAMATVAFTNQAES